MVNITILVLLSLRFYIYVLVFFRAVGTVRTSDINGHKKLVTHRKF